MNRTSFRKLFEVIATRHSATPVAHMTWGCRASPSDECIILFQLQQSSFGKRFQVMMYVFARGVNIAADGSVADAAEKLASCIAFRGFPPAYDDAFDLTAQIADADREARLEESFAFLDEFWAQARTREGLRDLGRRGLVMLPPAVLKSLDAVG